MGSCGSPFFATDSGLLPEDEEEESAWKKPL